MGHFDRCLENQNAKRNVNRRGSVHEFSDRIKYSVGNWARSHSSTVAKSLASFCLCPESLHEDECKSNGGNSKIKQHSVLAREVPEAPKMVQAIANVLDCSPIFYC